MTAYYIINFVLFFIGLAAILLEVDVVFWSVIIMQVVLLISNLLGAFDDEND